MRCVRFDPDALTGDDRLEWQDLVKAADRAKKQLEKDRLDPEKKHLDPKKRHKWRDNVWGDFKRFFFHKIFFGNCAYCEAHVIDVYVGDAEHYRPKGEVTQREAKVTQREGKVEIEISDVEIEVTCPDGSPHPGY